MPTRGQWLRAPGGLRLLFGTVLALPAVALVVLGIRLLQLDRALEHQRRDEVLQIASDRVVRALDEDLARLTRTLSDPHWRPAIPSPGMIAVLIEADGIRVEPVGALAYVPSPTKLRDVPNDPFRQLEAVELTTQDLPKAFEMSRAMAASTDPIVRAGALLREARILRKMGRGNEALPLYQRLAEFSALSVNGLPVDLQARKTRCLLLKEQSEDRQLRLEAAALAADLDAGRWSLDRASYEYVSSLIDGWLGQARPPHAERERVAAAVDWLYQAWMAHDAKITPSGVRYLPAIGDETTVVWGSQGGRLAAFVGGPESFRARWLANAQLAAQPADVALLAPAAPRDTGASPTAVTLRRPATETSLPWTVLVSVRNDLDVPQTGTRRKTLLAALAAVLVLVGAGSYLIVRSRNREIALADLQSDFVAAVSHEFRTPLTALRQFNALLDDEDDLTPERRRGYYQAQTRATDRLHRLVESLLDFGRMEAGKRPYAFDRVDAGLLVRDVVQEFREGTGDRGIAITCSITPGEHPITADAEAIARAVSNLLDNAVKYSGDGREINVAVTEGAGRVSIAVRDRGIGIPQGEQQRIFEKFARGATATSLRIKGTGIGLAMVKHIITAHRGALDVSSVEHAGSTFTLHLPCGPTRAQVDGVGCETNADAEREPSR